MRICHIITRLIIGGAQENTLLTCEGLHASGHAVTLLAGPETGREGSLWPRAERGGYAVERVDTLCRKIRPRSEWRSVRRLRRRLAEIRPDIVHTHSSKAGILGRIAARRAGVPILVHTIHGMSFNRTQAAWVRALYAHAERHCAGFTDAIICVADAMTAQAVAAGVAEREKFTTIHSGMNTAWYDPQRHNREVARAGWGFDPGHVVVGTVARLFRNKGYEQLIPAAKLAAARDAALRFVWVGDGAQRHAYEAALRAAGLADRVHLTGLVPPADVPKLLAGMDLLVHASQWEGLPRVLVQALLMQVPVISFDNDGAPEVVEPGQTGELVGFNDVGALAAAITALAADPQRRRRYARAGRARCLERFSHTAMVRQIDALYHRLAEPSVPSAGIISHASEDSL